MRAFGRAVTFIVAVLATAACGVLVLATLGNPHNDVTRAWTTLLALASGIVAVGAWTGFALLRDANR